MFRNLYRYKNTGQTLDPDKVVPQGFYHSLHSLHFHLHLSVYPTFLYGTTSLLEF